MLIGKEFKNFFLTAFASVDIAGDPKIACTNATRCAVFSWWITLLALIGVVDEKADDPRSPSELKIASVDAE